MQPAAWQGRGRARFPKRELGHGLAVHRRCLQQLPALTSFELCVSILRAYFQLPFAAKGQFIFRINIQIASRTL